MKKFFITLFVFTVFIDVFAESPEKTSMSGRNEEQEFYSGEFPFDENLPDGDFLALLPQIR